MAIPGAWATVGDVEDYTGATVTQTQIDIAQTMIEGLINRVWRSTDAATGDYYWLSRAVAWQARFGSENPQQIGLGNVTQLSQDGFSITFDSEAAANNRTMYSQMALRMLNNLSGGGGNTTIRFNSAFQKSGAGRLGWRRYGW